MIVLLSILLIMYTVLILAFSIGFIRVPYFNRAKEAPVNKFSIIIPFRDEANNLAALLDSLIAINYPKELYEILLVDDSSQDNSVSIIYNKIENIKSNIYILKNSRKSNSPKKDAINTAITKSKFEWVLTTDADCIVPENWLLILDSFIRKEQPKMIASPVVFTITDTALGRFQDLDFLALQATTIGAFGIKKPFLCNGANLCYQKSAFKEVGEFKGNEHIASGDDIFLMEKMIKAFPNEVKFLKSREAIVLTKPESTLKTLIAQRVRWAAKSTAYTNPFIKLVGITVLGVNLSVVILFLGNILGYFSWSLFGLFFGSKLIIDFILLFQITSFTHKNRSLIHTIWVALIYPIFSIFIVFKSFTSEYSWKGRSFKK